MDPADDDDIDELGERHSAPAVDAAAEVGALSDGEDWIALSR